MYLRKEKEAFVKLPTFEFPWILQKWDPWQE